MADDRPFTKKPYAIYIYVGAALLFILSGIGVYVWELKQHPDVSVDPNRPVRVLILGNGLLWMNDTAQVLRAMGSVSSRKLEVVQIAKPEPYSLAAHWNDGEAAKLLRAERWDFLVLQDAYELPNRDAKEMLTSTRNFVKLARKNPSTKVILVMPWTDQQAGKKQEVISAVSRTIADRLSLYIAPLGDIFVETEKQFPTLSAHAADKHNASALGAWLAAYSLYSIVMGTRPTLDINSCTFNSGYAGSVNADDSEKSNAENSGTGKTGGSQTAGADSSGTVNADGSQTAGADNSGAINSEGSQTAGADNSGTVNADGSQTAGADNSGTINAEGSETGAAKMIDIADSIKSEVEQLVWNRTTAMNKAYQLGPAPIDVPQK